MSSPTSFLSFHTSYLCFLSLHISYLVWDVELVVKQQISWLESTGAFGGQHTVVLLMLVGQINNPKNGDPLKKT